MARLPRSDGREAVSADHSARSGPAKPRKVGMISDPGVETEKHAKSVASVAEGAGFEPAIRLPVYTLSRRAPSTARPPLRAASCLPRREAETTQPPRPAQRGAGALSRRSA